MKNNLYIPKTITVGFQKRNDTFTGKLGYVIYTDDKGVLRKETSWNSWRDKNIDSVTFDNLPQTNFTFNKGVQRYSDWGSGRSVIRVYDQRDFEFEISVENLIGILMHSDVSKRDIQESCVFAWYGTELVLLPTNSEECQSSVKHTEKQGMKFSAKDLVPGYTYNVRKRSDKVVYLGYFTHQEWDSKREDHSRFLVNKGKKHFFWNLTTNHYKISEPKSPSTYIANVDSEEIHPDYNELLESHFCQIDSQVIDHVEIAPPYPGNRRLCMQIQPRVFASFYFNEYNSTKWTLNHVIEYSESFQREDRSSKATTNYYYQSRPGFSCSVLDSDPRILTMLNTLNKEYLTPRYKESDWKEKQIILTDYFNELHTKYGLGSLRYVYTDGRKANKVHD